ncbi:SDR family oxidoreductase [Myxococcota bacterium]|nr:SDR family oxidoreductase [Myxococcota bacterium]
MSQSKVFMPGLMTGNVALVTGGGTGIGAEIAREYARLGATVHLASRKREVIEAAARSIAEETGAAVFGHAVDIRDRGQVAACVEAVLSQSGRLDVLVNNGGGQFLAPAETITPRGFDAVVATNLTGTWNMLRAAADAWMLQNGGAVVNITMLTPRGFPGMAHSVAARAGVEALTRTLAVEWAGRGIRVNAIAPGYVASSGLKRYPKELGVLERLASAVPMKRLARREEIAWVAALLGSAAGSYITGQVITVDGGAGLWGDLWPLSDPEGLTAAVPELDPWEDDGGDEG